MIKYIVLALILLALISALIIHKPEWIKQITFTNGTIYICSVCGGIWVPYYVKGLPVENPPEECPHCHRKLRKPKGGHWYDI